MTEFIATTRSDRIGLDRYGQGPALIFIAGAGPFRAVDPQTTDTARRAADLGVTTVVYDRTGRGESLAAGRLDLDRELDTLRAVIDRAGAPAVLCGHSSGCSIALRAAADHLPVAGLALWEAPLATAAADLKAWSDQIEEHMDAGDFEAAMVHYMKDMPPDWLAQAQASPAWPAITAAVVAQRADAQSLAWAGAALEGTELARLDLPVLAMYGSQTFPEMPRAAERIAAALPEVQVEEVPGAHHMWEPAPMADRLARFTLACAQRHR